MMDLAKPLNEDGAEVVIASVPNPAVGNLVRMIVAAARMELLREAGQSEAEWRARLPASPVDMEFLSRIVARALARPEVVQRILDGASIAEATGWGE